MMQNNKLLTLPPLRVRPLAVTTLTVVAVASAFWLVFQAHVAFILLFAAIVLGAALRPPVEWLYRHRVPRPVGILLIFSVLVVVVVALLALAAPLLSDQVNRISRAVPGLYHDFRDSLLDSANLLLWRVGLALPVELSLSAPAEPATGEEAVIAITELARYVGAAFRWVLGIIVTLLLTFYWTLENERIKRAFVLLLPIERRDAARELISGIEERLGSYVIGQGVLMVIIAVMSGIAYLLIGLPYVLLLAVFAGITEAIPLVGPLLGAIPAIAVAYSVEPSKALWVFVAMLVIQQIENNLLVPRIMHRAVGVNPLLTLLAFASLGSLFGIVGALIAVPAAAILQLIMDRYLLRFEHQPGENPEGRNVYSVIRYRTREFVQDLRSQSRAQAEKAQVSDEAHNLEDKLEAIAMELDDLLSHLGDVNVEPAAPPRRALP